MRKIIAITLSIILALGSFTSVFAEETSGQTSVETTTPAATPTETTTIETQTQPTEDLTPEVPKTEDQLATEEADSFGTAAEEIVTTDAQDQATETSSEAAAKKVPQAYKQFADEFKTIAALRIEAAQLAVTIKVNNLKIKGLTKIAKHNKQTKKLVTARAIELEIDAAEHFAKLIRAEKNGLWGEFNKTLQAKQYRKAELTLKKITASKKLLNMLLKDITVLQAREINALK